MRKINTRDFRRATRSTPREVNRQIALNLVREHQPVSRADLARRMGLSRGMVTLLVGELIEEGLVYEGDAGDAPRGRKPTMLYLRTGDRLVIAADVRFSRSYVMLGDLAGTQLALETFRTIFDPAELIAELAARIRRLVRAHGAGGRIEGVGLVVPGTVDRVTGRVLRSPQMGWTDVEVREPLARATGLPVTIENAPIACALAQMWLGERGGDGGGSFVYVTVSDGVGAGIVMDGQVVRGHDQAAGEFGHVPLDPEGPLCLCGSRGCFEAYTSNLATLTRYLGHEPSPRKARALLEETELTVPELVARARAGDERARRAVEETGRYLGMGLAMIVNGLNPARIVVGGEITAAWDLIEPLVRAGITSRALTPAAAATPIIPELASTYPRLRGAAALVAAPLFAAPVIA
ncbi:MAG TPA: ROK family transcriptional regulator [Longimicrobiaceae bacterium]|nr:ROK family transcriptional regulator [Longimicrobiaceae bacterium]